MNRKILLFSTAFFLFLIMSDSQAFAASLEWEAPLQHIADNIQQSVVPSILTVMIAVTGMMVMFGEQGRFKPFLNIALGTALASQIVLGLTVLGFSGDYNILTPTLSDGSSIGAIDAIKSFNIKSDVKDFDLLSAFMKNYKVIVDHGAQVLVGYALKLLGLLAVIDLSVSLSLGLVNEDKVKYIFVQVLKIGFYVFLIQNWVGGKFAIAHAIESSFETIGFLASGAPKTYFADSIVQNGINTFTAVWSGMESLGLRTIGVLLADLMLVFTIVITTFFTAIEAFMVRIEFWTMALVTVPLLPFGMNKHTSFLAEKAVGAIFSLGIKIMVIAFLTAVSCPMLMTFAEQIKKQADAGNITTEFNALLQMALVCIILATLVHKIPNLAQGLISGSPSLVSGDLFEHAPNPVRAIASAGAVYGTYQMATNMEGGGTAMEADGSLRQYDHSWLGGVRAFGAQSLGTARNMAKIQMQKNNPFAMANMQTQAEIQQMRSNMAVNNDIAATAQGKNDIQVPVLDAQGKPVLDENGKPKMQTDSSGLYLAQKSPGATEQDGRPILNQGRPVTHGWTPPSKSDVRIDQETNDKINELYKQQHEQHGKDDDK